MRIFKKSRKIALVTMDQPNKGGNRDIYNALRFITVIETIFGIWPYSWKCGSQWNEIEFKWLSVQVGWVFVTTMGSIILGVTAFYNGEALEEVQKNFLSKARMSTASESFGVSISMSLATLSVIHYLVMNVTRRVEICGSWNRFSRIWSVISNKLTTTTASMNLKGYDVDGISSGGLGVPKMLGKIVFQTVGNVVPGLVASTIFYLLLSPKFGVGSGIFVVLVVFLCQLLPYASSLFMCTVTCLYDLMALSLKKLERQLELVELSVGNVQVRNPWVEGTDVEVDGGRKHKSAMSVANLDAETEIQFILDAIHEVDECAYGFTSAIKYHLLYAIAARWIVLLIGIFFFANWKGAGIDVDMRGQIMVMGRTGNGIHALSDAVLLFQLCRACGRISKEQLKLANRLAKMSSASWSHFSELMRFQVQNSLQKMYGSPTVISPGGFLNLNKGLLTSLLAGAVTYIVVLMQFNQ